MDVRPVLKSKVTVPQLSEGVLITERIKGFGIERNRVVTVVAPAGYGKTTAVLAAVKHSTNLHWYRLEKEDARLPIFYAHLLESLFGRVKKQEPESVKFLRSISDVTRGYELLNATICQDVWTLYGDKIQKRRYIVFDDFQHVLGNEQIIDTVRYFIANMPLNLHIIIASRKDTGIFDGVPGLRGDICFLSEKELSFSEEEISLYMKEQRGLILPPGAAAKVCSSTEGWISGVVLICNLMQRLGVYNFETYFQGAGKKNEIFRFFLTEALRDLSPQSIRSMALMATLEEFSITDIETAYGIRDAQDIIGYCEKLNLYIQKTISGDTTYRFHSLFRNFLLGLRNEFFSPQEIEAFNIKASDYYLTKHDYVRAIRHMLQARRLEDVVRLLCLNGKIMLDTGLGEHLKMLIEELPGQLVENNPYLSFFYGFTIMSSEFERSYSYLQNAMRLFEMEGDTDMQVQVMAVLFTAFAQRNDVAMIRKLVADCEVLDEKIKNREVRGTLLACRLGRAAFDEDFEGGLALYKEIRQYKLNDVWLYGVNNFNCMIHYRLGDLAKGRKIIEENLGMPLVRRNDQWKILNMVFCHTISLYMGDAEWSAWIRNELLSLGEKYSSGYALGFGKKDAAIARYLAHDIDHAVEFMNASAQYFKSYQNDAHVHRSAMYKNLWLLEENPGLVKLDEVMDACKYLVEAPVGQGFAETAQSFAGIVLRETGHYGRAEELLLASFKTSSRKKTLQAMAGTAMHLAKLYYDLKDHGKGDMYLKTFITISYENCYVTYYDLFFPTLVEMAAYCVVKDMHAHYAVDLVRRYYGEKAALYLAKNSLKLCSPKEARLFTARFGQMRSSRRIIRITMLGGFKVYIGDNPIKESEWKTRKIQGILKYLLLKRDQFVPKEVLADIFWPGTGRKAAMASINVALYELRRVLSSHGAAFEDEFPLIHDRGNGFEIKSSDNLEVDTDRLIKLYGIYKLYESNGGDIKPPLAEIVELYNGDLLPQDIYEDWTFLEREHIKSKFLEAAHRLSQIYIEEGALDEAEVLLMKTLAADPYEEAACALLVNLYNKTGRKSAAQGISRTFAKRLEKQLD